MKRSSIVLLTLALVVVAASAFLLFRTRHSLPRDPLAAVPPDAYGLVRIRARQVLASQAWQRLVVAQGEARGIERLTRECGFNPLEGIDELVVFARPAAEGATPRFAFLAHGPLKHEQLLDCVRKMTGKSGEQLTREDIEGIPAVINKKGTTRAAFVGRDGLVAGDAESVRLALLAVVGKAPSALEEPLLQQLYREGSESTDVQVVARMPQELLPLLSAAALLGDQQLSALASVQGVSASANLLKEQISGGAVVVTKNAQQAATIVSIVNELRERILDFPGIGLTGLRTPLRALSATSSGDRATFSGSISLRVAETLLELLPALASLRDDLAPQGGSGSAAALPASDAGLAEEDGSQPAATGETEDAGAASRKPRPPRQPHP